MKTFPGCLTSWNPKRRLKHIRLIYFLLFYNNKIITFYNRKYRPDLYSYRGNYKEWWHFAYNCILEEDVKRRRRNWDWEHMLAHRKLCKDYAEAYQAKLTSGKLAAEHQEVSDRAEKSLDLFNLVVIRQRIEMEVCILLVYT